MTDEKKLTDDELGKASGAGPNISASQTANRGTYGTGQVEQGEGRGETEPNPIPDSKLGQVKGGAATTPGGSSSGISASQTAARETLGESVESRSADAHNTQKDG